MSNDSPSPVWYEPHPVTPERKAELRAQGYRIIDALFKPTESVTHEPHQGGAAVAEIVAADDGARNPTSKGMKVEELRAALEAKGIAIPDGAKKPDLQKLLDDAS